jgi:hypothetical protein
MLNKIVLISVVMTVSKYLWIIETKYEITVDEAKNIGYIKPERRRIVETHAVLRLENVRNVYKI